MAFSIVNSGVADNTATVHFIIIFAIGLRKLPEQ